MQRIHLAAFSLLAAALGLCAQTTGAGNLPVRIVAQQHATFATATAFPADSGGITVDRAAKRITLHGAEVRLTVQTGPEENMMAFKIAGVLNPEIVAPAGMQLHLTVVNVDDDMIHNLKFSHAAPPYAAQLPAAGLAGTAGLAPHANEKAPYTAAELVVEVGHQSGYYLCSIRGHAKAGMYGKLTVRP